VREIRRLRDVPADVALGTELVREYVVATALETGHDIELILELIPELHDFAGHYLRAGAFLVAESPGTRADEPSPQGECEAAMFRVGDLIVEGAVGVTPGADGTCEMNRLWTRPGHRRDGLGRSLCEASMAAARDLGFRRMILGVVPERTGAIRLYRSLGFLDSLPVHEYPFPMVPLGRDL
jgi:ribosomal protein S18 acetylase RimI-like enzyme